MSEGAGDDIILDVENLKIDDYAAIDEVAAVSLDDLVFGTRIAVVNGCRTVILTNAAGGCGDGLEPGDLRLSVAAAALIRVRRRAPI